MKTAKIIPIRPVKTKMPRTAKGEFAPKPWLIPVSKWIAKNIGLVTLAACIAYSGLYVGNQLVGMRHDVAANKQALASLNACNAHGYKAMMRAGVKRQATPTNSSPPSKRKFCFCRSWLSRKMQKLNG